MPQSPVELGRPAAGQREGRGCGNPRAAELSVSFEERIMSVEMERN